MIDHSSADRIREIAPLIIDQRSVAQCNATQQNTSTGLLAMSDMLSNLAAQMAYAPIFIHPFLSELNEHMQKLFRSSE